MKYEKNRAVGTSLALGFLVGIGYGKQFLGECVVVGASFCSIGPRGEHAHRNKRSLV